MKAKIIFTKELLFLILIIFFSLKTIAQVPHLMHFQAVAHDASGALVTSKTVDVQLQIFDSVKGGAKTILYWEQQATPTDAYGYMHVQLNDSANPDWQYFGSYLKFSQIQWETGHKWLKILFSLDGVSFNTIGTIELISVPYSLVAETSLSMDNDFAVIADHQPYKTDEAVPATKTWEQRVLNKVESNSGSSISINNNQITLSPGTYFIDATVPSFGVNYFTTRLYNVTKSETELAGTNADAPYYSAGWQFTDNSFIKGVITVAATMTYEIDEICAYNGNGSLFGVDVNQYSGAGPQDEIYTRVFIHKLK